MISKIQNPATAQPRPPTTRSTPDPDLEESLIAAADYQSAAPAGNRRHRAPLDLHVPARRTDPRPRARRRKPPPRPPAQHGGGSQANTAPQRAGLAQAIAGSGELDLELLGDHWQRKLLDFMQHEHLAKVIVKAIEQLLEEIAQLGGLRFPFRIRLAIHGLEVSL
jgi:hypothetical protein